MGQLKNLLNNSVEKEYQPAVNLQMQSFRDEGSRDNDQILADLDSSKNSLDKKFFNFHEEHK